MNIHTPTTIDEAAERAASWAEMVRNYTSITTQLEAERRLHDLSANAGEDYPGNPSLTGALIDARDDLAHAYAPDWAGLGIHAQVYIDANEDDDWREKAEPNSPTFWLAKIIDTAATINSRTGTDQDLGVLRLLGAVEASARAFVHHRDGYQNYGCNPSVLVWTVDLITCMQESARRLADTPRYDDYFGFVFGAVWFGELPTCVGSDQ